MVNKKELAAHMESVGADTEQSMQKDCNCIIADNNENFNAFNKTYADMQREMHRMMDPAYLKTITMPNLFDTVFESQPPLIEGLLNRGTYLFVGSPKVGKSFMMAQIAYHVSTGLPLWDYKVRKSPVLYLALEDDYARLQQRLYQMFGTDGADDLFLATNSKKLGEGLEEQIKGFMKENPTCGLIIIDTLKRIRQSDKNDYSYGNDYDIVARLKALADSYKITLLIVHHTRKQAADDRFDMISGTNGLLGAADGAFVLSKKKRTDNEASLEITGRDQQDMKLNLVRDEDTLKWNLDSIETELWKKPTEPILEKIFHTLSNFGDSWCGSPTELKELLKLDIKPNTLTMKLNINAGRLYDEYGIKYENKRGHDGRKVTLTFLKRVDP